MSTAAARAREHRIKELVARLDVVLDLLETADDDPDALDDNGVVSLYLLNHQHYDICTTIAEAADFLADLREAPS